MGFNTLNSLISNNSKQVSYPRAARWRDSASLLGAAGQLSPATSPDQPCHHAAEDHGVHHQAAAGEDADAGGGPEASGGNRGAQHHHHVRFHLIPPPPPCTSVSQAEATLGGLCCRHQSSLASCPVPPLRPLPSPAPEHPWRLLFQLLPAAAACHRGPCQLPPGGPHERHV